MVGGLDTLNKMEKIATDKDDTPTVSIHYSVFSNNIFLVRKEPMYEYFKTVAYDNSLIIFCLNLL